MKLNISICDMNGIVLHDLIIEDDEFNDNESNKLADFVKEIVENHFDTDEV